MVAVTLPNSAPDENVNSLADTCSTRRLCSEAVDAMSTPPTEAPVAGMEREPGGAEREGMSVKNAERQP